MQLYFTGESLRNVQTFLRLQGVNISHGAVYKWINKYVTLMEKYLEQIKPHVSDIWRTDELYLKVKGSTKGSVHLTILCFTTSSLLYISTNKINQFIMCSNLHLILIHGK
jgi:hypothetical protein